ncbi:MAG: dipeptidyl-peptidase 3 family protein [Maricaulaceae bacterium]
MRLLLTTIAASALITSCATLEAKSPFKPTASDTATKTTATEAAHAASYDITAEYNKFAKVNMAPDTSFLSESERAVVNKLIQASRYMSEIYLLQLGPNNPDVRAEIAASNRGDKDILLAMFDQHYGVCDTLNEAHVFYGDTACPAGAGFYPADMSKQEFEDWIAAHPEDETAFKSGYTVIRRKGSALVAIPYSTEYKGQLTAAAALINEASELSENASLKTFLKSRAQSFMSDDYYQSEMNWMDLDGNIEVAIGPYETYDDGLYGLKTAFESFVTIKDPKASGALAKYKNYLRDMEKNLPVPEEYKNFKRGFESPIVVADQIQGGGDNVPGVQTIAFNLPNDERVREAKGAKKVILSNVLGAKYDRILAPIGERVLEPKQAALTVKKYMSNSTLFHELSHSLGPGSIEVDGRETTVSAELKELYSGLEEGKADVMGAYNILYMMMRGELPVSEKEAFLATYFTGLFRSMRFGIDEAHGKGAAFQYSYFREKNAVIWSPETQRFSIDFRALDNAITDLTNKVVVLQGNGNYDDAKAFLDAYGKLDAEAKTVLSKLEDIPYDIRPIYPEKI